MEGDFTLSHTDFNTDFLQMDVLLPFGPYNNNFQTITLKLKLENQYINSLMESNVYLDYCFHLCDLSAQGLDEFPTFNLSCPLFTLNLIFLGILAFPLAIYLSFFFSKSFRADHKVF